MRRFLAFITIAMLALAANAQQSPTDTDAVRSKLTMRGYKAFYDVNCLLLKRPFQQVTSILKMIVKCLAVQTAVGNYLADCYF